MTEQFDAVLAETKDSTFPLTVEEMRDYLDRLAAAHAAEVESLRETNRRMNRRIQMAEAALPSYRKLIAIPPDGDGVRLVNGNFGRALLTWSCEQLTERAEAAERDAGRLREILERIPTHELNAWLGGGMEEWLGATPTLDNFRAAIDACMGEKGNG